MSRLQRIILVLGSIGLLHTSMVPPVSQMKPRKIGRMTLFHHLATGGMAEVYLAWLPGVAGFSKPVVVKLIREELLEDEQFVQMPGVAQPTLPSLQLRGVARAELLTPLADGLVGNHHSPLG